MDLSPTKGKALNLAMRKGKRWLAAFTAGALGVGMLAAVNAPSAQAAEYSSVYCSGGTPVTIPGSPGVPLDPTTVVPDCSVPSGAPANRGTLSLSNNVRPDATFIWLNVSGATTALAYTGTGVEGSDWAQIGPQTLVVRADSGIFDDSVAVLAGTSSPIAATVTVRTTNQVIAPGAVAAGNTVADSEFTVSFYGTPAGVVITPLLYAIPSEFYDNPLFDDTTPAPNQAWISVVNAVDSAGNLVPLNPDGVTSPTTVEILNAPSANRDRLQITGVPLLGGGFDPFGVGVLSIGPDSVGDPRSLGTNTYTVGLRPTLPPLTANGSYVVSNTLAGSYTAAFDKTEYNRGERSTLTICAFDLGGRIVPDALYWTDDSIPTEGPVERGMFLEFNVEANVPSQPFLMTSTLTEVSEAEGVVYTENGCVDYTIIMPGQNVDFKVDFTPINMLPVMNGIRPMRVTTNGWAAGVTGPDSVTVKVGDGGNPTPPDEPMVELSEAWRDKQDRVRVKGMTMNIAAGETLNIRVSAYNRKAERWTKWRVIDTTEVAANGTFRESFERKGKLRVRVAYPKIAISNVETVAR